MDKDNNVEISFEISIREDTYSWKTWGKSEVKISIPLKFVELIDPGNIFLGSLQSAVLDYQEKKAEQEKEENEDIERDSASTDEE